MAGDHGTRYRTNAPRNETAGRPGYVPGGHATETFIHDVRFVFWVPRGSHTIGDLLVHLPDNKVLVAGDVLVSRVVPTLQDSFVKNWIPTLNEIQTLSV